MTLRGSVAAFPLETIVQLLAATGKTGQLEVREDGQSGTLGFDGGKLVSAMVAEDRGDAALGAVFTLTAGEFEFVPWEDPPSADLAGDLGALLDRAVVQRDRIVTDRQLIPHERVRFALSGRAADQGEVRLTPEQWKVLLAVNGERDLREIASYVGTGRLTMLSLLADLIRSGIIEVREAPPEPPGREPRPPEPRPPEPEPPRAEEREPEPPRQDVRAPEPPPQEERAPEPSRQEERAPAAAAVEATAAPVPGDERGPDAAPADPGVDERLAALSGVFAAERGAAWAPPIAAEPRQDEEPAGAVADLAPSQPAAPPAPAPTPAAPTISAPRSVPEPETREEPKKRGGLFGGLFKKDEPPARDRGGVATEAQPSERVLVLGALANALLDEYAKPEYGKGRLDDRIANLLMRVDEQADPIDHAIPVTRDRLDLVALLQRADVSDRQVAPYLALLVSQIYEDAERAFGKDRAKRGFRTAVSSVAGADSLGPDLRLPKA